MPAGSYRFFCANDRISVCTALPSAAETTDVAGVQYTNFVPGVSEKGRSSANFTGSDELIMAPTTGPKSFHSKPGCIVSRCLNVRVFLTESLYAIPSANHT